MTEPAWIGDQLIREHLDSGGDPLTFEHWLGGRPPDQLASSIRFTLPASVDEPLPLLDLSWHPPDPVAILDELCAAVGIDPPGQPDPGTVPLAPLVSLAVDPVRLEEAPTQELRAILKESE